jgi:uncharacterized protein YjiS (DUF1127 family)
MHACEHEAHSHAWFENGRGAIAAGREWLARVVRSASRRLVERRAAAALLRMDDYLLRDIGLTRAEALRIARGGRAAADDLAARARDERPKERRARPC